MNDFTKEELEGLLELVETFDELSKPQAKAYVKLISMINNYCEHKRCSPEENLGVPLHCLDCGRKLE